jgi:hypothetical protein
MDEEREEEGREAKRGLKEREHTEEPGFSNPEGDSRMNVSKEDESLPFDNPLSLSSLSFLLLSSESVLSSSPVVFQSNPGKRVIPNGYASLTKASFLNKFHSRGF